jgi:hypothetical protein
MVTYLYTKACVQNKFKVHPFEFGAVLLIDTILGGGVMIVTLILSKLWSVIFG